jgi:hypothetical protein
MSERPTIAECSTLMQSHYAAPLKLDQPQWDISLWHLPANGFFVAVQRGVLIGPGGARVSRPAVAMRMVGDRSRSGAQDPIVAGSPADALGIGLIIDTAATPFEAANARVLCAARGS